jgi:hypothetical protein
MCRRAAALAAFLALPVAGGVAAAKADVPAGAQAQDPATRATVRVAVVAPARARGRLGEELAQELGASAFAVSQFSLGDEDPRVFADRLLHGRADACVLVGADDRGVTIYLRAPGGSALEHTQLHGEAADRPSRRRLSLAVVERLRRIEDETAAPPAAASAVPGAPAAPPSAVTSTPSGAAASATPAAAVAAGAAPAPVPPSRRAWAFGASSALNLLSARGTPTGHVLLLAERKLNERLDFAAIGSWPVLGAQYTDELAHFIRTWTFDLSAGVNVSLLPRQAALRPVVGVSLGVRTVLAEGEFEFRGSRVTVTPALLGAARAGLRYRVRPLVDLVLEADLSRGVLVLDERTEYERATARERLLRIALGAVFEY